jgi:hypothetical protein
MTIAAVLSDRRSIAAFALLGVLLNLLGVLAPPITDDYFQWAILTKAIDQPTHAGSLFGLFDLVPNTPETVENMKASGRLLWSASDTLRMAFWRPLAELSHWLDYTLWPGSPALMRLHSLLWYGALIFLLGKLYRMLDKSPVQTGLATALFAISSLHFYVIMWIAARNQLMAACFCVLTLICHHKWRRGEGQRFAWLACMTLLLGLGCAEAAVATLGYLVAYAVAFEEDKPWRLRLRQLMPYMLIVVAWRAFHLALGFGSHGSGSYIEPGLTGRFLHAVLYRLPALMLGEVSGVGAGLAQTLSDKVLALYALAASGALLALTMLMRRWQMWADRSVRFYALGALFALVPVCAINPTDRILLNSELGMSALLAAWFCRAFSGASLSKDWLDRSAKGLVSLILFVHIALFPVAALLMQFVTGKTIAETSISEALSLPDELATPDKHFIVVNPPLPFNLFYYPLVRNYYGHPNPASIQALSIGNNQSLHLTVLDTHTIEIQSDTSFAQPLVRDLISQPFKSGDTTHMGDINVQVIAVGDDGAPRRVRFHFPEGVTEQHWQFFVWEYPNYYRRLELPPPGQSMAIAAMDMSVAMRETLRRAFNNKMPNAAAAALATPSKPVRQARKNQADAV